MYSKMFINLEKKIISFSGNLRTPENAHRRHTTTTSTTTMSTATTEGFYIKG